MKSETSLLAGYTVLQVNTAETRFGNVGQDEKTSTFLTHIACWTCRPNARTFCIATIYMAASLIYVLLPRLVGRYPLC